MNCNKSFYFLVLTLFFFIQSQAALADTEEGTNFWFMSLSRFDLSPQVEAFIDLQPRTELDPADNDGQGQVQQFLARTAIGYRLTDSTTLFQGYAAITNYDRKRTEHRFFQELLSRFSFDSIKGAQRFRFEQRLLDGIEEVGLRGRSFTRFLYPIALDDRLSLALNEEVFLNLNNADGGPRSGFDQNRLFLGVNYKISPELSFDFGYQNQYIERRGGKDNYSNHIIFLGAMTKFNWM